MSVSMSPLGGGGGGVSGILCVSRCSQLLLTELLFPSIVLFVSSSATSGQFGLNLLSMSNCTDASSGSTILNFAKLCLEGGVLLHLSGRASGYFGWKGIPEVLPNFLPPVDESLDDYHHLPRRLVISIYQTHQLFVLGILRQWPVSWYSDSLETEVLPLWEFLVGELLAALSTSLQPWVMIIHLCLLPIGHDPTLANFFLGLSPS